MQVTIRFLFQERIPLVPRTSKEERIVSNADIFDFELTEEEMQIMRDLNEDRIVCGEDPYLFHVTDKEPY